MDGYANEQTTVCFPTLGYLPAHMCTRTCTRTSTHTRTHTRQIRILLDPAFFLFLVLFIFYKVLVLGHIHKLLDRPLICPGKSPIPCLLPARVVGLGNWTPCCVIIAPPGGRLAWYSTHLHRKWLTPDATEVRERLRGSPEKEITQTEQITELRRNMK